MPAARADLLCNSFMGGGHAMAYTYRADNVATRHAQR